MSIVAHESFDNYPSVTGEGGVGSRWGLQGTTVATRLSLVAGRTGGQALRLQIDNGAPRATFVVPDASSYTVGFALRYTVMPTVQDDRGYCFSTNNSNTGTYVWVRPDGSIRLRNYYSEFAVSPAALIQLNQWHYVEFTNVVANSGGLARMWVDNTLIGEFSGDTLGIGGGDNLSQPTFGTYSGQTNYGTFEVDDVYFKDDTTRLGPIAIKPHAANGDTATKQLTPSAGTVNSAMVDEIPHDLDATYVSGSTIGDTDLYDFANIVGTPPAIHAVAPFAIAKRTDGISRGLQLPVKASTTQDDGAVLPLGAAYAAKTRILEVNPHTGLPWTIADVNALQAGLKVA